MPDTERLYAQGDRARNELAALDRIISESKDSLRASLLILAARTGVEDDGRCFGTILEAVDDLMSDMRDEIRGRIEEADIAISDAEWERV